MIDNAEKLQKNNRRSRRVSNIWARLAETDDGKLIIEELKETIGWDEMSPPDLSNDKSVYVWIGQRTAVKHILNHIKRGEKIG